MDARATAGSSPPGTPPAAPGRLAGASFSDVAATRARRSAGTDDAAAAHAGGAAGRPADRRPDAAADRTGSGAAGADADMSATERPFGDPETPTDGRDRFASEAGSNPWQSPSLADAVPASAGARRDAATGVHATAAGPEGLLDERVQALDRLIDDGSRMVREAVQVWPLASVGLALLLGMLVGRR